jgi:hypothetical protein
VEALMPYIHTAILSLVLITAAWIHVIGSYMFFRKYMEVIENSLSDISLFAQHREYYGNDRLGRKMRRVFILLLIVMPGIFKRQEVIPAYKLKKLSPGLLFGVKLIYHSGWVIAVATGLLYYFRLQHR